MTEAADAELTPEQAARTIEEARSYERPLRRRAEGVTWMIWGLVAAGIQLSFSAAPSLVRPYAPEAVPAHEVLPAWYSPLVVLGWLTVGVAFTHAVWRIASLKAPELSARPLRTALGGLLFVGLIYGGFAVLSWLGGELPEALFPTLAIGAAWLGVGVLDVFQTTDRGRRTLVAIGVLVLAAGVLAAVLLPWSGVIEYSDRLTYDTTAPITILAGGGIPLLAGLWQGIRG